ncbi:MAG: 6-phosphofructokinase [Bacteroidota bacterium]|nr:6-phosphofructokinase [Bacteroidota bacterium]
MNKIGVLTSGGDAPGMNAAIRAVVRTALYHNLKVAGIQRGYQGAIENKIIDMDSHSVSNIIQRGGTILKTFRSKDFMTQEGRTIAYNNFAKHGIDALIVIGGNGTYTGADVFNTEFNMPIVGLPGTIDNDLYGTDYTIGYDTAINTACEAIDKIRDTADSHDRVFFVEVMGRDSGFIALDTGICGGAEAILVPEMPNEILGLANTLKLGWGRKKGSQLIIVAEGDEEGGVYEVVSKIKDKIPDLESRCVILGHIQRGGSPTARDRVLASRLGNAAVMTLLNGKSNVAIGLVNDHIKLVSFKDAISIRKDINKSLIELADVLSS